MLKIVLYQPEIPPNTGNVVRLCANVGASLHLIEPLGFSLDDRSLRRAGMDYRELADVSVYSRYSDFVAQHPQTRILAFSTAGETCYTDGGYRQGDALLFGPETRGLPRALLQKLPAAQRLRIPMTAPARSVNLSNAVAVAVYEAWRQLRFEGGD
ncbi:MAG: tRNA (cytidine(34)-2'-O)-methyltransferase [Gammaproteobacteria bacterium]|nr:tRNA (cytidine(34)-2'-O)-methyltransferase [Gammaproteobacteria bacterium]